MWELYALWTWFPTFLAFTFAGSSDPPAYIGLWIFAVMGLSGVAGCLLGGWAADRWGRRAVALTALAVSGCCCLASPLLPHLGIGWALAVGTIWGAAVIADSGVFSTMLSERVQPAYAGTALTTQTAVGFAITVITIQLVPITARIVGWDFALVILAAGPIAGVIALGRLADLRSTAPRR